MINWSLPQPETRHARLPLPAIFMRGGTSRAVMFHRRDLSETAAREQIFLAAMGSPDPNGRQLNGMGGGISSLSKIRILAARRSAADGCADAVGRNDQGWRGGFDRAFHFHRTTAPRAEVDGVALHRGRRPDYRQTAARALVATPASSIRIGMPSGILTVDADVTRDASGAWIVHSSVLPHRAAFV